VSKSYHVSSFRVVVVRAALAGAVATTGVAVVSPATATGPGDAWCVGTFDTEPHVGVASIRIGVDPGVAGNPTPGGSVAPIDARAQRSALLGLRPRGRALVVRLNRLFWSGGEALLRSFSRQTASLGRAGFDVEVQVRYHPDAAHDGDIAGWRRWVRHVVDVLGAASPRLVALTVTNEVNLNLSSNTSDGSYQRSQDALIDGVEAAHDELVRRGWQHRIAVGFTFAYRWNPQSDVSFWQYLHSHGGRRFVGALGFVGLDDYPGTFYPPVLAPGSPAGSSPGQALAEATATMRRCYLPMGGVPNRVPIWVTENGYPSRGGAVGEPEQDSALRDMLTTTRSIARTYNVTDYRWFNLRDNDSMGTGMFDTDGLLRDDYTRKPAYATFRLLVARYGARSGPVTRG
jgi:hypothetical protein